MWIQARASSIPERPTDRTPCSQEIFLIFFAPVPIGSVDVRGLRSPHQLHLSERGTGCLFPARLSPESANSNPFRNRFKLFGQLGHVVTFKIVLLMEILIVDQNLFQKFKIGFGIFSEIM